MYPAVSLIFFLAYVTAPWSAALALLILERTVSLLLESLRLRALIVFGLFDNCGGRTDGHNHDPSPLYEQSIDV
jgi:hypothetical protein